MIIAVTYEDGNIFQHFGKTSKFKLYTVENGAVQSSAVVDTEGKGHGELAGFLKDHKADVLICGGMGGGAKMALADAGIQVYGGAEGNADAAVSALLAGKLAYNPDVQCNHHHDHGEGHTCHSGKCS